MLTRRNLLKTIILAGATVLSDVYSQIQLQQHIMSKRNSKRIRIESMDSNFEREQMIRPFGFKGGYMTEIWQVASCVQSSSGIKKVGLCRSGSFVV